jgi:hypothetical protein
MAGLFVRETRLELEGNGAASCQALAFLERLNASRTHRDIALRFLSC